MRKILATYIILLFATFAWAQDPATAYPAFPYECSFEESENLSAWTLNYGTSNTTDQWMIGTAVHSEGRRSLYVSSDGQNPSYGRNRNIVVTYLRYKFPTAPNKQHYDVSFDWKGVGDSTMSKLYVIFGYEDEFTDPTSNKYLPAIINSPNARLSAAVLSECRPLGVSGDLFVCGSETWQNVSFTTELLVSGANSREYYGFAFVWVNENNNQRDSVPRTAIAIDNFQINTNAIKKPQNVVVYPQCEDSSLLVTWESGLSEFDVQYRQVGETTWTHTFGGIVEDPNDGFTRTNGNQCSYVIKPVLEGTYDVRVRGKDGELKTNYVYSSNIFVYCPDNHCINYVNLYSPNVTCTYGYHPHVQSGNPYQNIGVINYGPDAIESRHTLHVDPTELDPRTDSLLHTVPQGALAAVRLGNWNWGGEAESITYDILVDTTTQGILIVKYAVVFENPQGHPVEDEPAFNLEIMDSTNTVIDQICGQASFTYSSAVNDPEHWHMTADGKAAWKDWTTVGLSLMNYHNQHIKVRFTTLDCGYSGHYAYAYFTVDCANAHIDTENCGNDASVTCIAPEGFAYEWRDENNVIQSTDRVFMVDAGIHTYTCRVSFIEEPSCYFEISTVSAPRFPVPEYTIEPIYGDCMSKLKFNNTSHVMNKFSGQETHTSERTNNGRWEFRSLTQGAAQPKVTTIWSPTYICREEGDTIEVTYTTYIGANDACDSTRVDTFITPNIIPKDTAIYYKSCSEEPVKFDGQWFDKDTVYAARFTNFAGCDSTSTLYLSFYPQPKDLYVHDSICSDGSVVVNGVAYNQPLDNYLIMMKTVNGCDSALYLTLTVNERLKGNVEPIAYACADDEQFLINFDFQAGVYDSVSIAFSTPELRDTMIYQNLSSISIPYSPNVLPGHYKATLSFYQFCCGRRVEEREFDIRYRSSIVEQKWNDVLTVLAPKYNGGFQFNAFQWYKNNMPLEGETHSYLYQDLDTDAEYYVVVTRPDGVSMASCPIQPTHHEQQTDYPTIVTANQMVRLRLANPTKVYIYSAFGQLVNSYVLTAGDAVFQTPAQAGIYIIRYEEEL